MRTRLPALAGAAGVIALLTASPAAAHGIGGRVDLPVPTSMFVWGAALAVVISFVALGALWPQPRLEDRPPRRRLPDALQGVLTSPVAEWAVRALSLAVFLVVAVAAAAGEESTARNLAPVFVFVWFWVGLPFLHALLGDLWATLSPWDTLARLLEIGNRPRRPYPAAWGTWPATILMFGFVWMELAFPYADNPRWLAIAIGVYTVVTLAGMGIFGREEWNRRGEAFAVYLGLVAWIAPLARDDEGRVVVRPFLGGLPGLRPQPGLVAFVMVLIGSTTYDGFSTSDFWDRFLGDLSTVPRTLAATGGLLGMILAVALAYSLAMGAAAVIAGRPWRWHPLAARFVHSLVPIAFAYVVAHYFSLLLIEGQGGVALISDPLGAGWNVFGTAGYRINLGLLTANLIWYVQVAAIVAGHVGGVVLAHDRAVAVFPGGRAVRTQYALLAVMVLFTVGGLVLLSGA